MSLLPTSIFSRVQAFNPFRSGWYLLCAELPHLACPHQYKGQEGTWLFPHTLLEWGQAELLSRPQSSELILSAQSCPVGDLRTYSGTTGRGQSPSSTLPYPSAGLRVRVWEIVEDALVRRE